MSHSHPPAAIALSVDAKTGTSYPQPFRNEVLTRSKRVLGDLFALTKFGVNLVELPPGSWSSQRHWHTHEDEFIYVLDGEITLETDAGLQVLTAGMVAGFPGGEPNGHHLINNGDAPARYLEIGDRDADDEVFYPDIDLQLTADGEGGRVFTRRDGTPYTS